MIAMSTMVLPGISGSTILLIFGLYAPILTAVKQVLKLNFEYLPAIIIFIVFFLIGCTLVPSLEKLKEVLKDKSIEAECTAPPWV